MVWLGQLRVTQGNLLGRTLKLDLEGRENVGWGARGWALQKGLQQEQRPRGDLGKTLKDKEGLNRLRRERKAVGKE